MKPVPPPLTALIDSTGHFVWTDAEKRAYWARIKQLRGQRVTFDFQPEHVTRSTQANAYYWGVVVALATDSNGDDPLDFHDEMCARFLARRRIDVVDRETGEAVEVVIPGRSSKLSIGDFYSFVEQVRLFCSEFLNVETPDPDPAYWRRRTEAAKAA